MSQVLRLRCLSLLVLVVGAPAWPQDVLYPGPQGVPPDNRFDPSLMASRLVVPETRVERFRFPAIDAHSHAYAKTPEAIAEWVRLQERVVVATSFILTGATGAKFRALVESYAKAYPGRFVMFAGFVKENVTAPDYAERLVRQLREDVAAGAAGLGELRVAVQ